MLCVLTTPSCSVPAATRSRGGGMLSPNGHVLLHARHNSSSSSSHSPQVEVAVTGRDVAKLRGEWSGGNSPCELTLAACSHAAITSTRAAFNICWEREECNNLPFSRHFGLKQWLTVFLQLSQLSFHNVVLVGNQLLAVRTYTDREAGLQLCSPC